MTEEQQTEVCETKKCECRCKELLCKFLLKVCAVFFGTLLAILVASSLLRPQMPPCGCPFKMMHQPYPAMEKQMPPMGMHKHFKGEHKKDFAPRPEHK